MNSILQELKSQSYLNVIPSDKYTDKLINMVQIIEAEKKKKKLIKNSIIAVIALIVISTLYTMYQDGAKERARVEREAERKAKIEKQEAERKAKVEEQRKKDNIYRVKHTIFIDKKINTVKNNLVASLNNESIDTTKETFYINKLTKLFNEEENKLISNIENMCTNEAGKETEAIDECIKNNKQEAVKRIPSVKKDLIDNIKKSILDLKFLERNSKLQKSIDTIKGKLQNEKKALKTYTIQSDSYIINGKNLPASLEKNIENTNYNIENYQHQIKHYKNNMKSEKLEIVKPTNLKKKKKLSQIKPKSVYKLKQKEPIQKAVVQKEPIQKEVIQKSSSNNISLQVKELQTKIDNIYIDGGIPSATLLNELKALKELQKQQ